MRTMTSVLIEGCEVSIQASMSSGPPRSSSVVRESPVPPPDVFRRREPVHVVGVRPMTGKIDRRLRVLSLSAEGFVVP